MATAKPPVPVHVHTYGAYEWSGWGGGKWLRRCTFPGCSATIA